MGKTCGILIVGDEILKGQTADTNSFFLCRRLFALGVKVSRITVIPDLMGDIAEEVSRFSKKFDIVITSGGVGPTHDDVTYDGVAQAFGQGLTYNEEIADVIRQYLPEGEAAKPSHPAYKMASIPDGAVLHYLRDESDVLVCKFPLVSLKNVYMFPGIPAYLERDFHYLEKLFYSPDTKFHVRDIFLSEDENNLTGKLNDLVSHSPAVTVGSYPEVNNRYYRTRVSLQSESESELLEAEEYLRSSFSDEVIVDFDINSISHAGRRIYDIIALRGEPHLSGPIASAVKILEECLDRYSTDEICISFNGGKDCTVILHLLHGVLLHRYPENTPSIQAVYITCSTPFDEVEVFIDQMVKRYNVTLWRIEGPIKKGLEELTKKEQKVKAILMGTRWTDPYSKTLQPFQMTDEGWPQFMRVSPILDWNYQTVWTFLRTLSVQYCTLYDHGYTSLGGIHNTIKNPHLKYSGEDKKEHHYPAYFLKDMALERAGRT